MKPDSQSPINTDGLSVGISDMTIFALSKSGEFDDEFYATTYPDVQATGLGFIEHHVLHGAAADNKPVWWFDTSLYTKAYPDVASDGINPFWHYLRYGVNEDRRLFFKTDNDAIRFAEMAMTSRDFETALLRWSAIREQFPNRHQGYTRASAACLELAD